MNACPTCAILTIILLSTKIVQGQSYLSDCDKSPDPGTCHRWTTRHYWDGNFRRCNQFHYSGCGGNRNNFYTEQDCINRCGSGSGYKPYGSSNIVGQSCNDPLKVYRSCGTSCPEGCDNLNKGQQICTLQCVPGCYCRWPDYVFKDSRNWRYSSCLHRSQCYTGTSKNPNELTNNAIAKVSDQAGQNSVHGILQFRKEGNGIRIQGRIRGLSPGSHGIHIHEYGDTSSRCFTTGSHFNPTFQDHGSRTSFNRHVGDLGNIAADNFGNADINIFDSQISFSGPKNILGRAVVIHQNRDDLGQGYGLESRISGNAGPPIGCGVIGITKSTNYV